MKKFIFWTVAAFFLLTGVANAAQITFAWDPVTSEIDGYKMYMRTEGASYNYNDPICDVTETRYVFSDAPDDVITYYVVRAYKGSDTSVDSNEVQYIPDEEDPTLGNVLHLEFNTAWETRNVVEYFGTTDQTLECSWPAVAYAEGYEFVLHHVERGTDSAVGRTTETNITFTLPRTGHYIVKVRACKDNYSECTEWSSSDNANEADVAGESKGWVIYGTVGGPGGIVLE